MTVLVWDVFVVTASQVMDIIVTRDVWTNDGGGGDKNIIGHAAKGDAWLGRYSRDAMKVSVVVPLVSVT